MDRPLSAHRDSSGTDHNNTHHRSYNNNPRRGGGGRGGGRRGGYHHHGGGGGRGRGFRDRGGRGGGGRYPPQYHHEPYGGGRGRGRGGGRGPPPSSSQSNRFCAEPPSHDPQFLLLQQLNEMLYQVGQVPHQLLQQVEATENQTTMEDDRPTTTTNESSQHRRHQRLLWTADNVARLTQVVCQRAHLFLPSSSDLNPKDAAVVAGPLASSLVQAVATGPLQTNPYTALTVAVVTTLQQSPPSSPSPSYTPNAGRALAERTVNYVLCRLGHDLNAMFLYNENTTNNQNDTTSLARRVVRVRLWLQYLVLLSRVGLVALTRSSSATTGEPDDNEPNDEDWMDPVVAATTQSALTLVELLQVLVQAATCVVQSTPPSLGTTTTIDSNLAHVLAHVVQSTLPYLLLSRGERSTTRRTVSTVRIQQDLVQPLHNLSSSSLNHAPHSSSVFEPGIGSHAILLPYEQDDAQPTGTVKAEDNQEEEEEDEMDDDDDDAARPLCDSLQELQTCIHTLSSTRTTPYPSRVSLFTDDPWNVMPSSNNNNNNKDAPMDEAPSQDGESIPKEEPNDSTMETNNNTNNKPSTTEAVVYTEAPLMLHLFSHCRALTLLLGGPAALSSSSESPPTWRTWSLASRHPLQGVVVGRLPIFGSPPTDDGEEEEDDEEEEEEHDNERLRVYRKTFGQVDRYFLGQAVRDCLLCHEPKVSPVGVERGTLKAVAEQVWSLRHFVLDSDTEPDQPNPMKQEEGEPTDATATTDKGTTSAPTAAVGLEFVVVEVILSLIVQSGTIWTESILDVTYLSRVLLELIKVEPAAMTAATVLGVATLVEDYVPTLTPTARYNLCQWFSFHLIHSNYQWPADYWTHWQSFVFVGGGDGAVSVWANSRGAFVRESLALVLEHASPDTISDMVSHLPHALIETMIPPESEATEPDGASRKFLDTLKQDLGRRIWGMEEDPFSILQYMGTDELQESFQSALQEEASTTETPSANATFWRTKSLIRALWIPLYGERGDLRILLLEKSQPNADAMDQDLSMMENETTDALAQVLNAIRKYRALIEGVVAQETQQQQGGESNDEKKKELALECECVFLDLLSECCLSYSRTAWITVTKRLLEESILSPMGLLSWSTTGSSSTKTETRDTFSFQHLMEVQLRGWCWEVCEAAMQIGGSRLFPVVSDYGHIGLTAARDTNDENATNTAPDQGKSRDVRNAESFVAFATPLIQLFLERVRAILLSVPSTDNDDDDNKPRKKLAPQHVAVLEGCKRVVHATRDAYVSCLETARTTRDASFYSDILAVYQESSLAGPNLATVVVPQQQGEEESTLSLQVLRQCLERMV